jgi:4-hydroxy-3-methylbut-2-enyl diphosphate reductase
MDVLLANPRGFCAGVDRAIAIVEQALERHGAPVYVHHDIVHNHAVLQGLRERGARFVDQLEQAPDGAVMVFSAHGVPRRVREEAARRRMRVLDATCPMVGKVHREVLRHRAQGKDVLLIGTAGHVEVVGTLGQVDGGVHLVETVADVARVTPADPARVAWATQTTLSLNEAAPIVAAIEARFPEAVGPKRSDICYASQNRQQAVEAMASRCDVVIVVGSPHSHNTQRLAALARETGADTRQVDQAGELDARLLQGARCVGVTAGASAPPQRVDEVIALLRSLGARSVTELEGPRETVTFPMPDGMTAGPSSFSREAGPG